MSFPSWLCGLDDVGEGVVESVGGVVSGSDGADWDVGAPRWTGGVGVLAGWLGSPVCGGLVEYHGSLRCW